MKIGFTKLMDALVKLRAVINAACFLCLLMEDDVRLKRRILKECVTFGNKSL